MLANAVNNFATELNVISGTIRARTVNQIKGTLKKKAFDEAGIKIETTQPPPKVSSVEKHFNVRSIAFVKCIFSQRLP